MLDTLEKLDSLIKLGTIIKFRGFLTHQICKLMFHIAVPLLR